MHPLFLLFLLGAITYFIVQRVSGVTRTPTWLLWLVAMTPALIWSGWGIVNGNNKPMPSQLLLIPFVVCFVLYWVLIQWGRVSPSSEASAQQNSAQTIADPPPPAEAASVRPIDAAEEAHLQSCFPWSIYYLQNIEYRPQAVICRGQLRSKPEVAYQTIRDNVEDKFGDRFYVVFQEGAGGKPFFALITNPQAAQNGQPKRDTLTRPVLAIGLLLATFFTTSLAWVELTTRSTRITSEALVAGLPYAMSLMAILGVHELGHYLTARRYKIRATLPYFIPIVPISLFPFGTFGAFIQIRSPIPNRKALFDVGIAGPLSGFVVALPLLLWGLAHSNIVPLPPKPEPFNFQALDPSFSLLLSLLSKLMLGGGLTPQTAIDLHPVAVAGCLGLVVTAYNLMPVGQLDGGHIVHAMFGQRVGSAISQVSRLLLLLLSLAQPYLLVWAILLFLMPVNDEPALNDVTELDNRRDLWGLAALAVLLLIILPTPNVLGRFLNL